MTNGETWVSHRETWNLGTCSKARKAVSEEFSALIIEPYDITYQRCCLAPKIYDLTCHDYYKIPDGWNGGALEISGHKYCDDFVDSIARRKLEVSSKYCVDI